MNSINKIKEKYYSFSDSIISKFSYEPTSKKVGVKGTIIISIHCMNEDNNGNYENVEIMFENVVEFRFVDKYNFSSTVIEGAFFGKNKHGYIIDFFPQDTGKEVIADELSDFSITFGKATVLEITSLNMRNDSNTEEKGY